MGYTNSKLVDCTVKSVNHSGTRTHEIDRITPHCVEGQLLAENIGACFPPYKKASCNYGIGKDGRVVLVVDEKNRSWCSSSEPNDQRAVTIECASDLKPPYKMNSAVYKKLITLCVDICKRNDKTELIWFGNREKTLKYKPKKHEMVLTVHRWFADKSCPGDWLYNRLDDVAEQVTKELKKKKKKPEKKEKKIFRVRKKWDDPKSQIGAYKTLDKAKEACKAGYTVYDHNGKALYKKVKSSKEKEKEANEKAIWKFLKEKGFNNYAAAGIMGNLYAESALNSKNLQQTFEKKLGMSDKEYTAAVDSGKYKDFARDSAGYGLAQWTYHSRKKDLLEYARKKEKSIGDRDMQLRFFWKELKQYTAVMNVLNTAKSVKEASDAMITGYERPADQSDAAKRKRARYSREFYEKFAKEKRKDEDCKPFKVKVKIDDLRIRTGPGTGYEPTGDYTGRGTFTVVELREGKGSRSGWGKMKNGAGWICLDYSERI